MHFLSAWFFFPALVGVILFCYLLYHSASKRKELLKAIYGSNQAAEQKILLSKNMRMLRNLLLLFTLILAGIAAARPYWGHKTIDVASRGRDVLIVFDVSKSMLATDVPPSRLAHGKYLAEQLIKSHPEDRFGLIAFAGNAFLECPLTGDHATLEEYIASLSCDTIPYGGTNLEKALDLSVKAFASAEGFNRCVIFITDGDELSGSYAKALAELKKNAIPVFVMGIGHPDLPAIIPIAEGKETGKYMHDAQGNLVKTALNETLLSSIALGSGGIYVRSTAGNDGLAAVNAKISALDGTTLSSGKRSIPIEKYPYVLGAAIVCLLLFLIASERPLKVLTILLLCTQLSSGAEPVAQSTQETPPATTEEHLTPEESYNHGRQLQLAGDRNSAQYYEKAIAAGKDHAEAQTKSFFNLGTLRHSEARAGLTKGQSLLQAQQLDQAQQSLEQAKKFVTEAEELYQQSLSSDEPALDSVGNNVKLLNYDRRAIDDLLKKIEELRKKQQQAQQQTSKAKQQNQQNQQNQQAQAQKALEELQKAKEAQQKQEKKQAQQHLEKAEQALGTPDQQKDQDQKQSQAEKNQQNTPDKEDTKQPRPQSGEPQDASKQPKPGEIDQNTAARLLKELGEKEGNYQELMKSKMRRNGVKVQKDW
ncbi:MAG: VWA domain-containing protein [Victivallaceae bacterium]|nr:VWA domain-containing protein [Victivallaceae bacterium]